MTPSPGALRAATLIQAAYCEHYEAIPGFVFGMPEAHALAEIIDRECGTAELERRLAVIAADIAAIKDEWLAQQPERINRVVANIRIHANPDARAALAKHQP